MASLEAEHARLVGRSRGRRRGGRVARARSGPTRCRRGIPRRRARRFRARLGRGRRRRGGRGRRGSGRVGRLGGGCRAVVRRPHAPRPAGRVVGRQGRAPGRRAVSTLDRVVAGRRRARSSSRHSRASNRDRGRCSRGRARGRRARGGRDPRPSSIGGKLGPRRCRWRSTRRASGREPSIWRSSTVCSARCSTDRRRARLGGGVRGRGGGLAQRRGRR